MKFFDIPLEPSAIEDNPGLNDLRKRALQHGAKRTQFGSIAAFPEVKRRLEATTEIIWGEPSAEQREEIVEAFSMMRNKAMVKMDRLLGQGRTYSCRLLISADFPQPALMWSSLLRPSPLIFPNFLAISIPEFPRQHVYVFPKGDPPRPPTVILLGVDYGGEHKMAFLRQYLYQIKRDGGLGLHAASATYLLRGRDKKLEEKNAVFLASSGTGKSTLSSHSLGLRNPEKVIFRQDDIVGWSKDGPVYGTEQRGFYVIVAGLKSKTQPNIWKATRSPEALFENVKLNSKGIPDFTDLTISRNPRASVCLQDIFNASEDIDLPHLDFVFLITRQFDIMPPVMRLSPRRAVYEFMCGRTVETAAADPDNIGKIRRTVGFNPFIMGPNEKAAVLAEEGDVFFRQLMQNPGVQVFLINTGSVGGAKDGGPGDIGIQDSATILREIIHDRIRWQPSRFGEGYEEPVKVRGLDMSRFDPLAHYAREEFERRFRALRRSDQEWLEQFEGW